MVISVPRIFLPTSHGRNVTHAVNNAKRFYSLKDTVLSYRVSEALNVLREVRTDKSKSNYSNPDNDPRGPWISSSYVNPATQRAAPQFGLPHP